MLKLGLVAPPFAPANQGVLLGAEPLTEMVTPPEETYWRAHVPALAGLQASNKVSQHSSEVTTAALMGKLKRINCICAYRNTPATRCQTNFRLIFQPRASGLLSCFEYSFAGHAAAHDGFAHSCVKHANLRLALH